MKVSDTIPSPSSLSLSLSLPHSHPAQGLSTATQDLLALMPFLILHRLLKEKPLSSGAGQQLRRDLFKTGALSHLLQCLQLAGHLKPRKPHPPVDETDSSVSMEMKPR